MSGTISLSLAQRFDKDTFEPLRGGKLYFYAAGTLTPQNAYQDSGLTIPHANPITLDAGGNIPQFFLADGQIKFRLTNAAGVQQQAADNVLVVGPSSGEGGGGSVDPTTVYQTGDLKPRYGTGAHSGWVRCNGRTIGRSTSGATERANADCQALFEYLWTADSNLAVSGGRGGSASADWAADKTIALPDWRGRAIAGLDDMGASAAGRLTSDHFGTAATALGAAGGSEKHQLTQAQLPAYNLTGNTDAENVVHQHEYGAPTTRTGSIQGGDVPVSWQGDPVPTLTSQETATHFHPLTIASGGSNAAHNNVQPTLLATIYVKL